MFNRHFTAATTNSNYVSPTISVSYARLHFRWENRERPGHLGLSAARLKEMKRFVRQTPMQPP